MKFTLASTISISAALLLLVTFSVPVVESQRFANILDKIKLINAGTDLSDPEEVKLSIAADGTLIRASFEPAMVKLASAVENSVPDAFWIDFHDDFAQHERFNKLLKDHPGITLRHEFWDTLNAVSIGVENEKVLMEILQEIDGIKLIEPVIMHDRPEAVGGVFRVQNVEAKERLFSAHEYTGVQDVHDKLKLFGDGIKIGIIDSGLDYKHPALGGCFGPGCKVAYGTDFVGDDGKSPDDDPMSECEGHGTHVAGIIAANDTDFVGVAPRATLGAYRVFGCNGGATNDLIIKALERAAADGMDVINLSLGGPGGWRQEREARTAEQLAAKGVVIVAAMGNEGAMGLFESGSPGVAGSVITVASTENGYRSNLYFYVQAEDPKFHAASSSKKHSRDFLEDPAPRSSDGAIRPILYSGAGDMDLQSTTLVQLAPGTSATVDKDGCSPITADLTQKVVLIRRGGCNFADKAVNALRANATGVIFMDNVASAGFTADTREVPIKARSITLEDGVYLLKALKAQKKGAEGIKLAAGVGPKRQPNPAAGFLSTFSSMGPDSELNSKPDIAAPGGEIWSTYPIKLGSYAAASGTSMASPYVAGSVALYLQGLPHASRAPKDIKAAFQNTAKPRRNLELMPDGAMPTGPAQIDEPDYYASVTNQGAGLMNMYSILTSKVLVTPSYLSLNDTQHALDEYTITVTNNNTEDVTYKIDMAPAAGLVPFSFNSTAALVNLNPQRIFAEAKPTLMVGSDTITVAAGESTTFSVSFKEPKTSAKTPSHVLYSGFVRLTPTETSADVSAPVVHVPFMGMQGNYKSVPILDQKFGLRVFDFRGRPLRASRRHGEVPAVAPPLAHPTFSDNESKDVMHQVATAIKKTSPAQNVANLGVNNDEVEIEGGRDMKVVFHMVTASELVIIDAVSAIGSDPATVESFGVLKDGVSRFVPRNDMVEGNTYQIMAWTGEVMSMGLSSVPLLPTTDESATSANNATAGETTPLETPLPTTAPEENPTQERVLLKKGENIRLRISLLKHFGDLNNDNDFESHLSAPFALTHSLVIRGNQ